MSATVQRVARPRGELSEFERDALLAVQREADETATAFRKVALLMVEKSSFRTVSELTNISTNTLQRWKREAGR